MNRWFHPKFETDLSSAARYQPGIAIREKFTSRWIRLFAKAASVT